MVTASTIPNQTFPNNRATALTYFESNLGLAFSAFGRYRHLIGPRLPRDDYDQIALYSFWFACLTYESDRGRLSTWCYQVAKTFGLRELLRYMLPEFSSCDPALLLAPSPWDRLDDQLDGATLFAVLEDSCKDQPLSAKEGGQLDSRDVKVLCRRFVDDCTLKEIGIELKVTKERIRQIEARSLRILKNSFQAGRAKLMS